MKKLVAPTQCSFVPGRHSSDNIIIVQKAIHTMRNKKGGKGFMAIKIDPEKAYDRLKWDFVRDTLRDIGVPRNLEEVVWHCISSPSLRVLWNGESTEAFYSSRGVRQGDPPSPYLFVLCVKRLSHLISIIVDQQVWKPIHLNRNGPPLSHLCSTDDLILFVEASVDQARIIQQCLNVFCDSSGHKVSKEKTRIYFSKNVHNVRRQEISDTLGFARTADIGKYLGVLIHHNRVSRNTY